MQSAMTAVIVHLFNAEGGVQKERHVQFIPGDPTDENTYNYDVYITDGAGSYVAGPFQGSLKDDPLHYSQCAGAGCPSVADGEYSYSVEKGTYRNVRAGRGYTMLRLGTVPTRSPNPLHNNQ